MAAEIDAVLVLARRGFRVHPLQPKNKIPVIGRWQERATTDEQTIRLWAAQYRDCNWGIATGQKSGIVVVDIDPKSGGDASWNYLIGEHGDIKTPMVRTGSGGLHYYFRYPQKIEIRNSSGRVGRGIDVRGEGGQVVAPGSLHPNGNVYEWIVTPEQAQLADLPKWLLELIKSEPGDFTPVGGHLERGNRNDSIYHAALALARQGVQQEFVMSSVMKWLQDEGQSDMDEDEVLTTIESAFATAKKRPIEVNDRSDTLNAELLISTYGQDLIYVSGIGWFHWNGKVWEQDLDDAVVAQLFIGCMKALRDDAARKIASATDKNAAREAAVLAQWAVRSMSAGAIKSAIEIASTFGQVRRRPEDIDGINTLWLLNCNNGTIDLKTGQLREHRKTDFITKMVPIDYDPAAKAPFWEETLALIFEGHPELVTYMQRALGYSITASQDERCFFICWGESGANGKSTILETIQDIVGPGYSQMSDMVVITSQITDNRVSSSLAKLQGARFVSMNEAEENQRLSEALVKQITGGDTVQACYKYKNPFEYRPVFKLWVRTNERPIIRSQTNAIWDRVKLIPFDKSIPKDRRLPRSEVDVRLRAEAGGILTWLVNGCIAWLQHGLEDPEIVKAAVQGYRTDSDVVKQFAEECMESGTSVRVKTADVYQAFVAWCKEGGERYIMTKTRFTQRLKASILAEIERSGGQNYVIGFKLNQQASIYAMI
jgi:putative DNA primase/helicase